VVEHHLAKVRVASSNLVIRSVAQKPRIGGVAERLGSGLQSRLHGFESRLHLRVKKEMGDWRSGSALP
jgi:hypothetical protein